MTYDLQSHKWAMAADHIKPFFASVSGLPAVQGMVESDFPGSSSTFAIDGDTATMKIIGPVLNRVPSIYKIFNIEAFDLADGRTFVDSLGGNIKTLLIEIDSPGGTVAGTAELADAIVAARARGIEVTAKVTGMMASAAMWIGAQADTIVATRMSEIGSIGVYSAMVDTSKAYKSEGIEVTLISSGGVKGQGMDGVEISDEAIAEVQSLIDAINDQFVMAVMEGRKKTEEQVRALNDGSTFLAEKALAVGLIDSIESPVAAIKSPQNTKGSFNVANLLDLVADHPEHAVMIRDMANQDASFEAVQAAIAEQGRLSDLAAKDAKIESLSQDLADVQVKLDATAQLLAEAEGKLKDLVPQSEQITDPGIGDQIANANKVSRADVFAGKLTKEQSAALVRRELEIID